MDFGFDDDENVNVNPDDLENNEEHEMPETAENLRRSAMAPPQGNVRSQMFSSIYFFDLSQHRG